jgi:hypothetical protein
VKILGHPSLADYDVVLYIDASVRLRETPEAIVEDWLTDDADLVLARHSYREQLLDEFDEVIRLNYDDRARVYEQLSDYAVAHPAVLEAQPYWTGMMVRRWSPELIAAMRTWADHVLRYSRRDQLSLPAALDGAALRVRSLDIDNFSSRHHEWPVIDSRRVMQGKAPELPTGPLVADLRRARLRIANLERDLAAAADREASMRDDIAASSDALRRVERQLIDQSDQLRSVSGLKGASSNLWRNVRSRVSGSAPRD